MGDIGLDPVRREMLLDWMDQRSQAFTIKDVSVSQGVHYQTAWAWMQLLRDEGLVERNGQRDGRADLYVRKAGAFENEQHRGQRAIRVAHGGKHVTIAQWVAQNLSDSNVAASAHALAYLLIRSYYADAADYQHLRGSIPALEVRAFVARAVAAIKEDLHVLEQLLGYRVPWGEGSELALRFGDLPVGTTMLSLQERAAFFTQQISPPPPTEVAPPVGEEVGVDDAPAPGRTLTELLEEAGGTAEQ